MIDRVYRTVQALINKENRGYLTPDEFNQYAHMAQNEIVEQYFSDYNFYENAKKAGKGNSEHADLAKHFQERINRFTRLITVTGTGGIFTIPDSLYRLTQVTFNGIPVEQEHQMMNSYAQLSPLARSNESRPTYTRRQDESGNDSIAVLPTSIDTVTLNHITKPSVPKWGYLMVNGAQGSPVYNSLTTTDFELHPGDEAEVIIKILGYTGISIRDPEVIQSAQAEMAQDYQKEGKI